MIGSATPFRNVGQFNAIPETHQAALESGLSFFEIRFAGEKRYSQNIFGFFDVKVERDIAVRRGAPRFITQWRTGRDAKITYNCINQKNGLSVAFMVDDPFWHNRIMMAFNPTYMIYALHTQEGTIPGAIASKEIDCLREICLSKRKQYVALNQMRRVVFADDSETVVDEYIKSKLKPGRLPPLQKSWRESLATNDWVTEIITENQHAPYGWTNCPAFVTKIKEPTERLIESRGINQLMDTRQSGGITQDQIQDIVSQTLRSMTPDQIRAILNPNPVQTQSVGSPVSAAIERKTETVSAPERPENVSRIPEWKTTTFFQRLKMETAREIAQSRGILGYELLNRKELTAVLFQDETRRREEWEAKQKTDRMAEVTATPLPFSEPTSEDVFSETIEDVEDNDGSEMVAT